MRRRHGVWATAITIASAALLLTGCGTNGGGMPSDDELFEQARSQNLTFKAAVAEVQSQIDGGEWLVREYGDGPYDCEGGYEFDMTRTTPESWRIESDAESTAKELGEWLGTNGWTDVQVKTFDGDIESVIVQARNLEAGVERLDLDVRPGSVADGVILRATSTCFEGDPNDLMALMYPGWPADTVDTEPLPETEAPDATPIFGFTPEGAPRR